MTKCIEIINNACHNVMLFGAELCHYDILLFAFSIGTRIDYGMETVNKIKSKLQEDKTMLPRIYRSVPSGWDNFFGRDYMPELFSNGSFKSVPAVNILEGNDGYTIEVAAPGLNKKDFNIHLDNKMLTISSERESKDEKHEGKTCRKEFSYNSFKRSFSIPDSIDTGKIKASHKDGILYVELPKREEAKVQPARQISIS